MDEYIKRETALALVRPDAPEDEKAAVTIATAKKLVRDIVRRTPAADVAPVVHCKDCRYWGDADGISTNVDGVRFARCRAHNHYVAGMHIGWCPADDDFCSYGAREDGDSDGE